MSTATVTWQIAGKELISFINAKNNKIYKSNSFYLNGSNGSAKFMLECYSNGMNKGEEGSVDLFLKILCFPEHASDITLRYILQCVETNTSFTKIKTFNRETTNSCWPYNTLQLVELCKLNLITFECDLQILSIKYKKSKSVIGTITNYFNSSNNINIRMNKYISFTWNIYGQCYDNFMNCKCRKQINSPLFGGNNDPKFFQLECYPNGTKLDQRGNVVMGLSLLLLPPLISSIKLFYSFECIECNKEWSNVHNFNYNNSVKGWPIGLIKQDLLYKKTKRNKCITFKCNIEILKLYNESKQEIHQKYWQRFIIDNTNDKNVIQNNNRNNSYATHELKQKDITIVKLTQNIINLQHTVDIIKKELYNIKINDRNNNNNSRNNNNFIPHALPPLNVHEPEYNDINNAMLYKNYPPKHHHNHLHNNHNENINHNQNINKRIRHPRSRSDLDQLQKYNINNGHHHFESRQTQTQTHIHTNNINERPRGFYPYNNSQSHHEINYNKQMNINTGHGHGHNNNHEQYKKRKTHHASVNGIYGYKHTHNQQQQHQTQTHTQTMGPLVDDNINENNYNHWYKKNTYKNTAQKHERNDEGFAQNIRSFVQINDLVNNDLVTQIETNNNPFFNNTNEYSISTSDDTKEQIINEGTLKGLLKAKSMGTPNKNNNHKKSKSKSKKKRDKKQKQKQKRDKKYNKNKTKTKTKTKAFYRSQSEKKIIFDNNNNNNNNGYGNNASFHKSMPRFIDSYDSNDDIMNYGQSKGMDKIKLKKWLCNDIGLNIKYYNLFLQNGYDNIDIVVELKENDLIDMGITNKKYRIKLLKEFAKFNPFIQETMGGPNYI